MNARPSPERDARLLQFDFLGGDVAEALISAGACLASGAAAENLVIIELALRNGRAALLEGIAEFRELSPEGSHE